MQIVSEMTQTVGASTSVDRGVQMTPVLQTLLSKVKIEADTMHRAL